MLQSAVTAATSGAAKPSAVACPGNLKQKFCNQGSRRASEAGMGPFMEIALSMVVKFKGVERQ
jgi:hypothetical protein